MKKLTLFLTLLFSVFLTQTSYAQDTDGDGILNAIDLDDDNDGILDINEGTTAKTPNFSNLITSTGQGSTFITGQIIDSNPTCTTDYSTSMSAVYNYTTTGTRSTLSPRGNNQGNIVLGVYGPQASAYEEIVLNFTNPTYVKIYNSNVTGTAANPGPYGNFDDNDEWTIIADAGEFNIVNSTAFQASLTVNSGNQIKFQNGTAANNVAFDVRTTQPVTSLTLRFRSLNTFPTFDNYSPIRVEILMPSDADCDSTPNYLDLDSDNDGCVDAVEGDASIPLAQLVSAGGVASVGTGSSAVNKNLCGGTTCVNAQGLPQLSPVPTGYSNSTGQAEGTAYDPSIGTNACKCFYKGATGGTVIDANHGISALGRAGDDGDGNTANDWPMARKGAWTVLEAKTKGFVINRVPTTASLANITPAIEGMMVYDEEADCLKIYTKDDDPATTYSWRCFSNQTCPDVL